jgi:hypothetical protein
MVFVNIGKKAKYLLLALIEAVSFLSRLLGRDKKI